MNLEIGTVYSKTTKITDKLIRDFAELSGDRNPLHLDEEFAKTTSFGNRIAHGMILGALISGVLGNEFDGKTVIYLSQNISFRAPVLVDDFITVSAEITAFRDDRNIVSISTPCTNQDGKLVAKGIAKIIVRD